MSGSNSGVREVEALRRRLAEREAEVSSLRASVHALRKSEQKYRQIADHSGDCLWVMDLETLRFTYVSPSVTKIYGSTPEETMSQRLEEVLPPRSLKIALGMLERELPTLDAADPGRTRTVEIEEYRKDGSLVWIENTLSVLWDERQRPVAIIGVSRDVSERRRLVDELANLAVTDPLTGAFNRRYLLEELLRELKRCERFAVPFSLIMLDIDHFKVVNDRCGHEMGDRVLVGFVELIRARLRVTDLLARWGGEEFLILLVNTALPQALVLADALRERIQDRPFPGFGSLTASLGVAQYRDGEGVDALLTRVDNLMYQAKWEGRNRVAHDRTTDAASPAS